MLLTQDSDVEDVKEEEEVCICSLLLFCVVTVNLIISMFVLVVSSLISHNATL